MYRITFALDALGDHDLALCEIAILLEALTKVDEIYLRAHPEVPALRTLGIAPTLEPQGPKRPGQEDWQDVPTLLRPKAGSGFRLPASGSQQVDPSLRANGFRSGSSRDLSCLLAAEMRVRHGVQASPLVVVRNNRGRAEYDVAVRTPDGTLLSPSSPHPVIPSSPAEGNQWRAVGADRHPTRQRVSFVLGLFQGDRERNLSNEMLQVLLDALAAIDCELLARRPDIPDIYASGVRYEEEPPGCEDWQDAATCLRMGKADCDDLSCWLTAQRRVREGVDARSVWKSKKREDGGYLYHILTKLPDGRVEDPSYVRGMR